MRLIDADVLLSERMRSMYYHLPNGDTAVPLIDIEHAPTIGGWISVKDRMPAETHSMFYKFYGTPKWRNAMWREESDLVLVAVVFDDGTRYVSMGRTHDGEWNTNISKVVHNTATHWMPLPEPPEVSQNGET